MTNSGDRTRYPLLTDDAHLVRLKRVGIAYWGVEIQVRHEDLKGSDIPPTP
jgi:hypothetical protein